MLRGRHQMNISEKTSILQIRITPELKNSAEDIFEALGMNTSQAISIFLKQVVLSGGIPFRVGLPQPNAKTTEAINEIEQLIARKDPKDQMTKEELFKDLGL
jgi:DNA-damage-inducible protein J